MALSDFQPGDLVKISDLGELMTVNQNYDIGEVIAVNVQNDGFIWVNWRTGRSKHFWQELDKL